jgi:murein DD-endopeptidase MepM/ murein hydrolase activator NlpD
MPYRSLLLTALFGLFPLVLIAQVAHTQTAEDFSGEVLPARNFSPRGLPTRNPWPKPTPNLEVPSTPARPADLVPPGDWRAGSFPVENFQGYTSPFGYRSIATGGSGSEFHSGLDFAAPLGSYVRNWWAGRVIEVSDNTACGTLVRVQSGAWVHVYCHLQGRVEQDDQGLIMSDREAGLQIRVGQFLPAGARIGRVGMTGRTTGPHLHWTVKYQGELIDPALVLLAMRGATTPQDSGATVSTMRPSP